MKFSPELFTLPAFTTYVDFAGVSFMDTERFVSEQNIKRFRKLASVAIAAAEKRTMLALLAEEEAKFIELAQAQPTNH